MLPASPHTLTAYTNSTRLYYINIRAVLATSRTLGQINKCTITPIILDGQTVAISIELADLLRVVLVSLSAAPGRPISDPLVSCLRTIRYPYNLARQWFNRIRYRRDAKFSVSSLHSGHNSFEEAISTPADTKRALDGQYKHLSKDTTYPPAIYRWNTHAPMSSSQSGSCIECRAFVSHATDDGSWSCKHLCVPSTIATTELSSDERNHSCLGSTSSSTQARRLHRGPHRTANCSDSNWKNGRGIYSPVQVRRKRCGTCGWQPVHSKVSERAKVTLDSRKLADRCFHQRFHFGREGYRCFLCINTLSWPKDGRPFNWMAKHVAKNHTFAEVCDRTCQYKEGCGERI